MNTPDLGNYYKLLNGIKLFADENKDANIKLYNAISHCFTSIYPTANVIASEIAKASSRLLKDLHETYSACVDVILSEDLIPHYNMEASHYNQPRFPLPEHASLHDEYSIPETVNEAAYLPMSKSIDELIKFEESFKQICHTFSEEVKMLKIYRENAIGSIPVNVDARLQPWIQSQIEFYSENTGGEGDVTFTSVAKPLINKIHQRRAEMEMDLKSLVP